MGSKNKQKVVERAKIERGRGFGAIQPKSPLEKTSLPPQSFLIILAAILVCYVQTLSFQWTRFDDDLIVTNNIELYEDFSQIGTSFTKDAFNNKIGDVFYRPIQNLSFFIDAQFSGASPIGFKITNLLLHFLTCISLLFLFRSLQLDYRLSFLAVLVYSVHPLFNHAVVWIPSRGDLLITLFGILSYIALLRYLESNGSHYLLLHTGTFLLAAFSKETALLFPLVFVFHIFLFKRPVRLTALAYPLAASWILIISLYLYCRSQVILNAMRSNEVGIGPLIGNLRTLPEFLGKFVFPAGLSVMPVFSAGPTLIGLVLLMLLGWRIGSGLKSGNNLWLIGMAWFLLFTAVTMLYRNGLGKAAYDYLEHRAYLPMVGFAMFLVAMLQPHVQKGDIRKIYASALALVAVFAAVTLVHSRDYENPMAFYAAAIRSNPRCAMAYYNRAQYKRSLGDRNGAILDYGEAIRVKPDFADAFYNRGNARKDEGDVQGALLDYTEAIRWNSGLTRAYYNRGTVKLNMGDLQGALNDLSGAIALNPNDADALNNRGVAYLSLGQVGSALAEFSRAIEVDPNNGNAWRNRGSARLKSRDAAGACEDWRVGNRVGNREAEKLYQQYCR